jgi:hypothetical protein
MIQLMIRHKCRPGKIGELKEFCAESIRIWQKHGCKVLGEWSNWIGGETDEIMYIFTFKDFAEYEDIDVRVHRDPEWRGFIKRIGEASAGRSTELLRPTEFSPLK